MTEFCAHCGLETETIDNARYCPGCNTFSPVQDPLFEEPRNKLVEPDLEPRERNRRTSTQQLQSMYRRDSPQTSVDAAKSVLPHLNALQQKIVDLLEKYPEGLTVSQMCGYLDLEKPSVSPRPGELIALGLVYEAGTRNSNRGRKATIYKLTDTPRPDNIIES